MKHLYLLHLLMLALIVSSCSFSSGEKGRNVDYDLYEVNVRSHLNVRANPSKTAAVIGKVSSGTKLKVTEMYGNWAKVRYRNKDVGYVSAKYLVLVAKRKTHDDDARADENLEEAKSGIVSKTKKKLVPLNHDVAKSTESGENQSQCNVRFIGDSLLISRANIQKITDGLAAHSDYHFVINIVDSVPIGKMFDYAPDLLGEISKNDMNSSMTWWERVKHLFGGRSPSDHLLLLSYIADSRLLHAECNGNSLKYLRMQKPEEYFDCQKLAMTDMPTAVVAMADKIVRSGNEYDSRSRFVRVQVNTGSIIDNICDGIIVENILNRDSFWHKWVFGWMFAVPFSIANFLFSIFGSYFGTLLFLMLLIIVLQYVGIIKVTAQSNMEKAAGCLIIFSKFFLWLCMLSMLVYIMPDMTNLTVMQQSGYSSKVISCVFREYSQFNISKNWFLIVVFIIGTFIAVGFQKNYVALGTLPSRIQKQIFDQEKNNFNIDYEKLSKTDNPYLELAAEHAGEEIGKVLAACIILSFIFSGTLLLYAAIYLWTIVLQKILYVFIITRKYRKLGMYR